MEKIKFSILGEDDAEFYVLEQTMINGISYILVTDQEDGDADCWILKDTRSGNDTDAVYTLIEDDEELNAVAGVFSQMMEDVDLI